MLIKPNFERTTGQRIHAGTAAHTLQRLPVVLIGENITCLLYTSFRQQLRSARLKANLTAEVAEEEDEAEEIVENG